MYALFFSQQKLVRFIATRLNRIKMMNIVLHTQKESSISLL